jgi:hypothetical protein
MEVTAAVLYDGALAHYDVNIEQEGVCVARLSSYKGRNGQQPPELVTLRKEGRRWISDEASRNLAEDIGYAVELKVPREVMQDAGRRRNGVHPAG